MQKLTLCGCVKGRAGEDAFWYGKHLPIEMIEKAKRTRECEKPVYQFDLNGNKIGEYISMTVAAKCNNTTKQTISRACNDETKTGLGYFWSLDEKRKEFKYDSTRNHNPRKVLQYDLSARLINVFESAKEATMKTGICKANISHCCRGRVKTAGGYIWRYDSP